MNQTSFALNVDINTMYFMIHSSTLVSGENACSGIENSHVIRHEFHEKTRKILSPISPDTFGPFPPYYHDFLLISLATIAKRHGLESQKKGKN